MWYGLSSLETCSGLSCWLLFSGSEDTTDMQPWIVWPEVRKLLFGNCLNLVTTLSIHRTCLGGSCFSIGVISPDWNSFTVASNYKELHLIKSITIGWLLAVFSTSKRSFLHKLWITNRITWKKAAMIAHLNVRESLRKSADCVDLPTFPRKSLLNLHISSLLTACFLLPYVYKKPFPFFFSTHSQSEDTCENSQENQNYFEVKTRAFPRPQKKSPGGPGTYT